MTQPSTVAKVVMMGGQDPVRTDPVSKRRLVLLGAGVAALVVLVGLSIHWVIRKPEPPLMTAKIEVILQFTLMSSEFENLPFERRAMYMIEAYKRFDAVEGAWQTKKISREQWWHARSLAYFGKHLERIQKLSALTITQRDHQLDSWCTKPHGQPKFSVTPDLSKEEQEALIRERIFAQTYADTWQPEWRRKWYEYHEALEKHRKQLEKDVKKHNKDQKAAAAAAATRPAAPGTLQPK